MVLIENCNPVTTSGSYARLFGDTKIGKLITKIQSASITMGNDLEKQILKFAAERGAIITDDNINDFFNHTLPDGVFIIPKSIRDRRLKFSQKPDIIVVSVQKNTCKVIEIKLGDNFDTKKSSGEKEHLESYARKLDQTAGYRVSFAVCMFFADNKQAIIKGFKGMITEHEAITGRELCNLVGIDYNKISDTISTDQTENRLFLMRTMLNIFGDGIAVTEQRELLIWFKNNRPMMWKDIFCDDCPEVK